MNPALTSIARWAIPLLIAAAILALVIAAGVHGGHPIAGAHYHS